MIMAFNSLDRERRATKDFYKEIEDYFIESKIAGPQQDERQKASMEVQAAREVAENRNKDAIREMNVKKLSKCMLLYLIL